MNELLTEPERKRIFNSNKWFFSVSGIGRDMAYTLISTFLLNYIQFGVALSLAQFTALSVIIGVGGRIWDAVNDPIMGAIIEGTHFRSGKFRPWIIIGALLSGLFIILMFGIQDIPGWRFVVFMSVMYLLWESTFTMNDIGYWAMLPSLSSVKEERDTVTTLTVLFAGVGAIIAQGVIPMMTVGDMRAGYRQIALIIAVAFIACQSMAFFGVKETPRPKPENEEKISVAKMWKTIRRNDQILWMTLAMLFYNIASMMLIALAANLLYLEIGYSGSLYFYIVAAYGITSVLVNALYPFLVKRLKRRRLQNYSILTALAGYMAIALMGWLNPMNIWVLAAFVVLVSAGQSLFYMASIVNMTNCVEYNDYRFGERNEAVVSTLRPFMAKFAAAVHTLIVTIVLALSGTYLLSQSISALEVQRDFFVRLDSNTDKIAYMEKVQGYLSELAGLDTDTAEYKTRIEEIGGKIAEDEFMCRFQLDSRYLLPLGDALVIRQLDGKQGLQELGRLGSLDISSIKNESAYHDSAFFLEVGDVPSGTLSAVNLHFREKRSLHMRLWVRAAASLVPIALLLLSLFTQKKKFVIDEDYYDKMMKEIGLRNKSNI